MPSGLIHTRTSIAVSVVSVPVMWWMGLNPTAIILCFLGVLSGIVISPDLDVDSGFYGLYVIRRLVGQPVSLIWQLYWLSYSKIVPHRSFWSHSVFGTLFRIIYLFAPALIVLYFFGFPVQPPIELGWWALGLFISDLFHISMDRIL